jgi:hypothetical protein
VSEPVKSIVWEKQSHKRYSANVGRLHIEVKKLGMRAPLPSLDDWGVGEVFGSHHLRRMPKGTSFEEAKAAAEEVARDVIIEAAKALGLEVRRVR